MGHHEVSDPLWKRRAAARDHIVTAHRLLDRSQLGVRESHVDSVLTRMRRLWSSTLSECIRQLYAARPSLEILLVQSPSSLDVTGKWLFELGGEKRHSVLPSLTVTDRDLVSGEVHILHA